MPLQISSQEIDPAGLVGYAKSLGFNVFFGSARSPYNARVFWNKETGGDLKDFLRVAKSEGVRLVIVDFTELEENDIEDNITPLVEEITDESKRSRLSSLNQRLESFRSKVGKCGDISVSWIKDNVEYVYSQTTEWWDEFEKLEDEFEQE
jgi:hypothetical protein